MTPSMRFLHEPMCAKGYKGIQRKKKEKKKNSLLVVILEEQGGVWGVGTSKQQCPVRSEPTLKSITSLGEPVPGSRAIPL